MSNLVSVCIPAYNNADYIADTIQSVLNQSYNNIELIVVDDNSKDNTWEVISGIKDPRLKVFRNEENLGMTGNWNRCVELAQGELVKLICADDLIENDAIEKEARAFINNPSAVLVESDTKLIDINGKQNGSFKRYPVNGLINGRKLAKRSLMLNNFFGAPVNNMFRKSAFEYVGGFDSAFVYILDFDLWVSIACLGDVYIIHEPLNSFTVRNDSNTGKMINSERGTYVAEHRKLVVKHSSVLGLSKLEIELSVIIRKFRNVLIGVYLKLFAK